MNMSYQELEQLLSSRSGIQIEGAKEAPKMPLDEALKIAEDVVKELSPYCERIEIAGSIRRRKSTVKDIEIVCIPKQKEIVARDLFDSTVSYVRDPKFVSTINNWKKVKGCPAKGKYTQRVLPQGIKVDIFTTSPEQWGLTLAIRTGSADYTRFALMVGLKKVGCKSIEGMVMRNRKMIPIREEKELFDLLGIDYLPPEKRSW